ncbi:rhodanese-like domain-containing protein [Siphonobacter sp.]|uniref:rhodanese-like domain-containing protein n=1 Tax=Siphonobacter sp. TaxID=1869184 RepID=UPI003B3BAC72
MEAISAFELKRRLDAGEALRILDIRTPYEWESFSIGGLHIPLDELLLRVHDIPDSWKNEEIVVICGSGMQSAVATRVLAKQGFSRIHNLEGGLQAYLSL